MTAARRIAEFEYDKEKGGFKSWLCPLSKRTFLYVLLPKAIAPIRWIDVVLNVLAGQVTAFTEERSNF